MEGEINRLKIVSFNCCGVTNKLPIIQQLCDANDFVVLKQTWLLPHNIGSLDGMHRDFEAYSISAVDCTEALVGRPYGGLSILWRKSSSSTINIVTFDDSRILGLDITARGRSLHIINVYLPFYSADNYDLYIDYIGRISGILESRDVSEVIIIGDFNAKVNGEFYEEWLPICEEYNLLFADVQKLPETTYTHVNNGTLTAAWLDHCVMTQTAYNSLLDISVEYNYHGSDHFPLIINMDIEYLPSYDEPASDSQVHEIKWDFNDTERCSIFFDILTHNVASLEPLLCGQPNNECQDADHREHVTQAYDAFVRAVSNAAEVAFNVKRKTSPHRVIGWNDYVRNFYDIARTAFLIWREAGSPRVGITADNMRKTRAHFRA